MLENTEWMIIDIYLEHTQMMDDAKKIWQRASLFHCSLTRFQSDICVTYLHKSTQNIYTIPVHH